MIKKHHFKNDAFYFIANSIFFKLISFIHKTKNQ